MSQAKHSVHESVESANQYNENDQYDAEFGLSWRDLEIEAKLNTAGRAVREGAETVLELAKVVALAVVAIFITMAAKGLCESKL